MAAPVTLNPDASLNLSLALVAASSAPLLLLDGDLTLIAASRSFCESFDTGADRVAGQQLFALGGGEWDVPQLRALLEATARGDADIDAYEMDLVCAGRETRRLVLNVKRLDYGDADHVRLVVAVLDVTDARLADRLKDELLREKAVLLQEVQHRVANSLQIIASVLMQSARKVQSEESRIHLRDAHNRVMSIASVQQQLAVTQTGQVELQPYFTQLCKSLGASMIQDPGRLSIGVDVDDSETSAEISVSLGLIVTELVINALKHAFPGRRKGRITVAYHDAPKGWTLSVADNGVGMPASGGGDEAKAGLGTSIVQALAAQLQARVMLSDGKPGTRVSVWGPVGSARPAASRAL
ncbi:sensor histidine kinase [Brevundimonas sp. 2R-24]|uniref:histidine kinase n=1 Tax=Peiella sedimenti TaxID=3061083 RepID=A0ABT8SP78_9CAUL|nr:sensor histidine kinase [Caulobacteraceae bacterium XZ-24]